MNEKTGLEHYEKLYGDLNLAPDDAAKWIFLSGWNSAMGEAMRRVNSMPFGNDTRASFAVYFQQMMVLDPEAVKEKPTPVQPVAWVDLLKQAEEVVRSKSLWKKYIDGTPLANDIAVWMASFAQEHTTPPEAQPATVPVEWMETVTANLVREGINKHKARELAEHFYAKLKEKNT